MNLDDLKSNLELICGINPVYSLLRANAGKRKIYEIYLSKSRESNPKVKEILSLAKEKYIQISILDMFLSKKPAKNTKLIILDNITDIGNFGAIIRSAFAFEFDGIIIPKHRSVEVNKDVSRTSAGTLEEINIYQVPN